MLRTVFIAFLFSPAIAADITVSPGESIQAAIDAAVAGEKVLVSAGTYSETIDFGGKAISIIGVDGALATTLDGGGVGPVVRFFSGEGPDTLMQGLTIQGGIAGFGAGGIAAGPGTHPTIEDCIVRNNVGKFGGGVSGSPFLNRCSIYDNRSGSSRGGGVYGAPQMKDCVVARNISSGGAGAGAYLVGGSVRIEDSVFVRNIASFSGLKGGGVYIDSTAQATIVNSVIAGNSASSGIFTARGGGIYAEAGGSTVDSCVVASNNLSGASVDGGGIFGPVTVINSIVRGNVSPQIAGGATITYSDVQGGYAGLGNFDLDPDFADTLKMDYHLLAGSPCIDTGSPNKFDPDGTRSDVGAHAFQSLYTRDNTLTEDWMAPSGARLSTTVGGHQGLITQAGTARSGFIYLVLGSVSGVSPGFNFFGTNIPLNQDAYFQFRLTKPGAAPLSNALGLLDGTGSATTEFVLPTGFAPLAGLTIWHATIVVDPAQVAAPFASNAEAVELLP